MDTLKVFWASRRDILPIQITWLEGYAARRGMRLELRKFLGDVNSAKWLYYRHIHPLRPRIVIPVTHLEIVAELAAIGSGNGFEVWKSYMFWLHTGCRGPECPNYSPEKDVLTRSRSYFDDRELWLHYRFSRFLRVVGVDTRVEEVEP